jgi:hypothetical protein
MTLRTIQRLLRSISERVGTVACQGSRKFKRRVAAIVQKGIGCCVCDPRSSLSCCALLRLDRRPASHLPPCGQPLLQRDIQAKSAAHIGHPLVVRHGTPGDPLFISERGPPLQEPRCIGADGMA